MGRRQGYGLLCHGRLILHTRCLEHVCPLATRSPVAVFQVLSEVVCTIEFFTLVAFAELVDLGEVLAAGHPVGLRVVGELFATVSTNIDGCISTLLRRWHVASVRMRWHRRAWIEGSSETSFQSGTGPRVTAKMERILMSFGFVLVLESIVAVLAEVLLLRLMLTMRGRTAVSRKLIKPYSLKA